MAAVQYNRRGPMNRRDFLKATSSVAALPVVSAAAASESGQGVTAQAGEADRAYWVATLRRLADPVLNNLANGTLKARMPVEQAAGADRRSVSHLEAIGRLVAGIAPWLALSPDETAEGRLRRDYGRLTRQAIAKAVDPASPDYL